ncbi:hypothetical protein BTJ40_12630 [Microbulbifer sp. A4B17]|nr:hypothetical protein BTJ40_12630 [Microbulbifer sp. A4B17]
MSLYLNPLVTEGLKNEYILTAEANCDIGSIFCPKRISYHPRGLIGTFLARATTDTCVAYKSFTILYLLMPVEKDNKRDYSWILMILNSNTESGAKSPIGLQVTTYII